MSGSKSVSRSAAVKRDGSLRYATRHMALEKGKRNQHKDASLLKACDCSLKSEGGKGAKHIQNSKLAIKKAASNKCSTVKDGKGKATSTNHREKVVIVSKRSSSVSVVKSCSLRKSVSVKKVSYSTSVVLSSDEDSDSEEEESEEEKEVSSRKTRTVVKRTTSKVKSSFTNTKPPEKKSAQKAKAIKLLCEKLSTGKHKDALANRELRPRFPYSMLQEIPTARTHRMASLNALAKVHVLYENEGRTVGENLNDADETTLIDFLNDNSDDDDEDDESDDSVSVKKESKSMSTSSSNKRNEKAKSIEEKHKNEKTKAIEEKHKNEKTKAIEEKHKNEKTKAIEEKHKNEKKNKSRAPESKPPVKRRRKRKVPDVEIIDTRICKRMASLNAQAILAASYLHEPKPKRISKKIEKCDSSSDTDDREIILESKCDIEIIETEKKGNISPKLKESQNSSDKHKAGRKPVTPKENSSESPPLSSANKSSSNNPLPNWSKESDSVMPIPRTTPTSAGTNNVVASTTATKVGLTQYTEVTKVQINTCQDTEIKEESKSERKIERILSNDDVAITQMYHYQSKNSNESYCLQMQTTYKPASRNLTPPSVAMSSSNPVHPQKKEPVLPSGQNYYGGSSHNPVLPPQPYHMNSNVGPMSSTMGISQRVPRQYGGSAFTVPQYRHPQQSQLSQGEYGYYQPAGPLIQPTTDQCTIHKPVPYHPQPNLHHRPQRPQTPGSQRRPYQNFPPHQPSSNTSLTVGSSKPQTPHRQKHIIPACPPPLEILPPQPKHARYPVNRASNEAQHRGFSRHSSYDESAKQQSPSRMISSYSTENKFSDYNKQRATSSTFGRYPQPYEQKDSNKNSFSPISSFNSSRQNMETKHFPQPPHEPLRHHGNASIQSIPNSEVHQLPPSNRERDHLKNASSTVTSRERPWSVMEESCRIPLPASNFPSYQEDSRKVHAVEMQDPSVYPPRPPSVIEIIDEIPRDTKTYIQLEVPRNSHREKIVVVDVESDEIEEKHHCLTDKEEAMPPFDSAAPECLPVAEKATVIKIEQQPFENTTVTVDISGDNKNISESADVTILEVKKKRESAVVRRARLHGKQRTFRDCYNRPLAQLSKTKKREVVTIAEEHLGKKFQPLVSLPRLVLSRLPEKKPIHGWSWEGPAQEKLVYVSNDDPPCLRRCYPSIRHFEGDVICVRDSVFLRSGPRKTDLPFVARITALWENPEGEMNMSLLWYYRPEHTETGKKLTYAEDEIFASKHKDTNSVACIEDKCFVLTYAEYCRYRKRCRLLDDTTGLPVCVVPEGEDYPRAKNLPLNNISPDLVLFCRKVYDYRQKRLLKNPV